MKIAVIGAGYVGLANALFLAQHQEVSLFDIDQEKIGLLSSRQTKNPEEALKKVLADPQTRLDPTDSIEKAMEGAQYVLIATPTDYREEQRSFETTSIEETLDAVLRIHPAVPVIIKSTIPVGYTSRIRQKYHKENIFFCPEFLREGSSFYDVSHPSRIVMGGSSEDAQNYVDLIRACMNPEENVPVIFCEPEEAEAIKLFSNAYLALRVSFFNEVDTFAEVHHLNSRNMIDGICADERIGNHYNNPSFGYGGYCLPKDTKQLSHAFDQIPNAIIGATVEANGTRKQHILNEILSREVSQIGIYRLTMKTDSDNFRQSAINDIIDGLIEQQKNVVIYEPLLTAKEYKGCEVIHEFQQFCDRSELILANRMHPDLEQIREKVYTRDLYAQDK